MQKLLTTWSVLLLAPFFVFAQTNEWGTQYVTFDDTDNGTENRTASVAVVDSNDFVALVARGSSAEGNLINYLVGYVDADSANGRLNEPPATGVDAWEFLLDRVDFSDAFQIAGGPDNLVYLANNDANHNILVFELTESAVVSAAYRMETGAEDLWAIEVDTSGYVYVCDLNGDDTKTDEVKIYPPVTDPNAAWETSHDSAPVATIDLPPGEYRGITASGDGSQVFVSQSSERSLLKFTGSPSGGYTADTSFDLTLSPADTGFAGVGTPTFLGLAYVDDPGIVFAAVDTLFFTGDPGGYQYGRIYVIDAATGANVDTVDVAEWNFAHSGAYNARPSVGGGILSGYTSTYDVDVNPEEANTIYSQSYYGWTIEKWLFDGDLGTIVSVEQISENIPQAFVLKQNYPNPFNPSTTIEFDVEKTEHITLSIYNILGQKVTTLVNERLNPGSYKATFDASGLTSGIFFYSLEAGNLRTVKKMIFTK